MTVFNGLPVRSSKVAPRGQLLVIDGEVHRYDAEWSHTPTDTTSQEFFEWLKGYAEHPLVWEVDYS